MESGNRGMKAWYAWSRAGSRPPLRGATRPGCPAFGGASWCARPWPPLRSGGPLRPPGAAARLRSGASLPAPRSAPRPPWGRWPLRVARAPSAPLGSLRGSLGLSAGRLRPSARPRPSPGGPRCGGSGSGFRGPWLPGPSAPSSGGLGRWALVACRPLAGALRSCRPPACAPSLVAPGPPPRGPVGRPGFRPGPPRLLPPGAAGAAAPPFSAPPPPSVGVVPVGAVVGALRSSGPPAVLVGCPAALVVGAGGPCHLPKITVKGQDKRPPVGLGAALDGDLQRRQPGGNAARPGLAVTAPVDMVGRTKSKEKPSKKEEKRWKPKRKC